ncbi:hypothetical protein HDV05_001036, partial [Chytridiales sp. JEL 0842]
VLRGAILVELSFRGRIDTVKEIRKRPLAERLLEVKDERPTGEVLLDEALKLIKQDQESIGAWIDLMSGETWNLLKVGYQLKQVRERIAKGLVDKGVLRTEKRNFVLFDMATHPVADHTIKEKLVQRVVDTLLGRGPTPDRRTIAMVCAAYAANVLENALVGLSHNQREAAFVKVDDMLQEFAAYTDKSRAMGNTEIAAGVLSIYSKIMNNRDPDDEDFHPAHRPTAEDTVMRSASYLSKAYYDKIMEEPAKLSGAHFDKKGRRCGVRTLKDLSAEAVANFLDFIPSLEILPWQPLGKQVYTYFLAKAR